MLLAERPSLFKIDHSPIRKRPAGWKGAGTTYASRQIGDSQH